MCGRYTLTAPTRMLRELFQLDAGFQLPPRYNIAPTQGVATVRATPGGNRRIDLLHWGLIPSWSKDPAIGARMINARSETVAEKPSFRGPLRYKRCLIPADGFYEWRKEENRKQPYYVCLRERKVFAFAGLWDHWTGPDGSEVESCTILTCPANDLLRSLHERMPVILPPAAWSLWLDPSAQKSDGLLLLLRPYPPEEVTVTKVSLRVNRPQNDDPACIEAAE